MLNGSLGVFAEVGPLQPERPRPFAEPTTEGMKQDPPASRSKSGGLGDHGRQPQNHCLKHRQGALRLPHGPRGKVHDRPCVEHPHHND